ncbi:MAG: anthranilate synthase component I family protein [Planctomycetaceae bacterium]
MQLVETSASHHWIVRRWFTPSGALVAEAAPGLAPAAVFAALAPLPHALFLDSARTDAPAAGTSFRLGRHSFVTADPVHVERAAATAPAADGVALAGALGRLSALLADLAAPSIPGLPPFQGGVAGFLSYECGLALLGVPTPPGRDPAVPLFSLAVHDVVFAHDHDTGRGWFISQGVPARGPAARRARAAERLEAVLAAADATRGHRLARSQPGHPLPGHPLPGHPGVTSSHTRDSYLEMVARAIELIRAGDMFQVNLAQRFAVAAAADPIALHALARTANPAPFAACLDLGSATLVSMSPERFLQVARGVVRMHPIKGTRRVTDRPEADLHAGADLRESVKDRAENVMIVDLVRNDLARVCTPASVRVEALCRLERYSTVQHLVSIAAGRLRPGLGPLDALVAALPAGSVTGAPKHRACEIISDLEGFARAAYCGSVGYVGFDGAADFNLLIRTLVATPDSLTFAAGGGITAASEPAAEHAESLDKAEGVLRVIAALGAGAGGRHVPGPSA